MEGRMEEGGSGAMDIGDAKLKTHLFYHRYLYYKRRRLYLCSAKDPVLHGSGSRRVYRRKGTSFDRV